MTVIGVFVESSNFHSLLLAGSVFRTYELLSWIILRLHWFLWQYDSLRILIHLCLISCVSNHSQKSNLHIAFTFKLWSFLLSSVFCSFNCCYVMMAKSSITMVFSVKITHLISSLSFGYWPWYGKALDLSLVKTFIWRYFQIGKSPSHQNFYQLGLLAISRACYL